jgi:amino acid transporter
MDGRMTDSKPKLGFLEAALFAIVANIGLRWLPVAAAVGPSAFPMWILALVTFFVPLAAASIALTNEFKGEGGLYVWTRETYGPLAAFLCGWFYWFALFPFLAGILYFLVGLLMAAAGLHGQLIYLGLCLVIGLIIASLQVGGLGVGKWVTSFGATGNWLIFFLIIGVGVWFALRGQGATDFAHSNYLPPTNFDTAILWGTIVFAFSGVEGMAFLRDDIAGGARTVARAIVVVGVSMAVIYILGTAAMLTIMPQAAFTRLGGFADALHVTFAHAGVPVLATVAIVLLALVQLGGFTAWFGIGTRLPMQAGIDNFLPPIFAHRNENTGAPVPAIMLQGGLILFMVALGAAGASTAAAYDFLVSMSVLTNTVCYLFVFAAYMKVRRGSARSLLIGIVGEITTIAAIVCTMIPSGSDPHPMATFLKIAMSTLAMVVAGLILYWLGTRRQAAVAT